MNYEKRFTLHSDRIWVYYINQYYGDIRPIDSD